MSLLLTSEMRSLRVLTVSLVALLYGGVLSVEYCVKPDNGENCINNSRIPLVVEGCHNLSYYVNNTVELENSLLHFYPGHYFLKGTWNISDTANVSLVACDCDSCDIFPPCTDDVWISCSANSGISFWNVHRLTIIGISLNECSLATDFKDNKFNKLVASAILMINVSDLSMLCIIINNSRGWGLYGDSILGHSSISNATITGGHSFKNYTGGNLRLKYYNGVKNANISVNNSTFENGRAYHTNNNTTSEYSGGIDIFLHTTNSININFLNVTIRNNTGYDGGNVAITYQTLIVTDGIAGSHLKIVLLNMEMHMLVEECLSWKDQQLGKALHQ